MERRFFLYNILKLWYNAISRNKFRYTYYTQNAHGDVVNLTDKDGKVAKKYTYDAFGVEKNIDENDTNAFRYCGEYYDAETGTIYLRARYYNPSTGRFISRDSNSGKLEEPLSLNLYTYCHNNPIDYMDSNGHERIVVSGGRDGSENLYNFIETAIKKINAWNNDDVKWMVAAWNYSASDMVNITKTAIENGYNLQFITDKQQLFDYINKDGREDDLIDEMAFFAHGTAFDQYNPNDSNSVPNPGYENNYAISMGYSHKSGIPHNNNLNIFKTDLCKIDSSAFSKKIYTYFGACRTGNVFNNTMSFAQEWANMTGGLVTAATGKNNDTGRTNYQYIYSKGSTDNWGWVNSALDFFSGTRSDRSDSRADYGFSTSGCLNYPIVDDGGRFEEFYPNFY